MPVTTTRLCSRSRTSTAAENGLPMARANSPDAKAPTGSYGALSFTGADAPPQTGGAPSPQ
jgi:hypothetical protein